MTKRAREDFNNAKFINREVGFIQMLGEAAGFAFMAACLLAVAFL